MRLRAPLPGWTAQADVVVIGSGVAGLTTALQIRAHNLSVLLVTKSFIDAGSTKWAQGGIAAALGPGDSPDQHEKDTLVAGAGLCDLPAVKVLVSEGPEAVRKLIARGAVLINLKLAKSRSRVKVDIYEIEFCTQVEMPRELKCHAHYLQQSPTIQELK